MFNLFKKNKKYTDEELFQVLEEDGLSITEQDIQKARENDPEKIYKIGEAYFENENYKKAFTWLHKAALLDHDEAQTKVVWMYLEGEGVSRDYKQAMDWSMRTASKGNAKAQYNVGLFYHYGWGVSKDYRRAIDWYFMAANNGSTDAMLSIGFMYLKGKGVTKDIPSAIEWFTKTANQGYAVAQYNLGYIYEMEVGFKDLQKAVHWYQKALDNGDKEARKYVKKLNKQGYYAKKEEQEIETIQDNNATNTINNVQRQPPTTSNSDGHLNKAIDDKIEDIEKTFQAKMSLMEGSNDALQKELAALKQKELEQDEENQLLKERLARMEAGIQDDGDNDLNYDSSDNQRDNEEDINYDSEYSHSEEDEKDNATANMTVTERESDALKKELAALKQKELEQDEENRLLKEKLTRVEAEIQDEAHNDLNYDSSDNEDDNNNDINYDSEFSEEDAMANTQKTRNHRQLLDTSADPNYDSSDNEDPKNDIYLD